MYIRQKHEHDYALTAPWAQGPLAAVVAVVGTAVSAATTIIGGQMAAKGAKEAGRAEQQAAEYRAKLLEQKANESRATAQRGAFDTVRKTEQAQSALRARAAASGAGASDESVLALGEQITGQGEYERLMQMYSGENQYVGYQDAAKSERYNGTVANIAGQNKAKAIQLSTIGSVASTVGSFAEKAAGFGGMGKGSLPSAPASGSSGPLDLTAYMPTRFG